MENKNTENNKKAKKSFWSLLFISLFGGKSKLDLFEEEQIQSPFKTMIETFKGNKLAMTGFWGFIIIFLTVLIGPLFHPIDLSYSEVTQANIAPGKDMMRYPKALEGKVAQISMGPTFGVGLSTEGKIYVWGKTKISQTVDLKNMPVDRKGKPVDMGKVVKIAAGYDHILALNDKGDLFAWGSDRQKQSTLPPALTPGTQIKDIYAGYQISFVLTEDGRVIHFGNLSTSDFDEFNEYQGRIDKLAITSDSLVALTKEGDLAYLGILQNSYRNMPESKSKFVDITGAGKTVAAVDADGKVYVWGNRSFRGEGNVPEFDEKIVSIKAGSYHYVAQTESGKLIAWGDNAFKEGVIPDKVAKRNIQDYYSGFYQNYAITDKGQILTWGLKGYLLGTDDLGRDIFTRLLNGGRLSMTVGAVAVIISTLIGVILGSISGYFGGKVDMFIQRLAEVVSAIPFLPLAMILSAVIGNSMTSSQRIRLIMVILGLLGWTGLQRLIRAQVFSIREQEFIVAAKSVGIKQKNIIFKHILPNIISIILVSCTLSFAGSMLTESALSYLGFGVQAPYPTWGNMLYGANNSVVIQNYWWRWVFASIILGVCVICINIVGDGLRDAIDPKSQER